MIRNSMAAGALFLLATASAAQAQYYGDTTVNGGVNVHVGQGTSVVSAMGSDSSAVSMSSTVVEGSHINGFFNANTSSSNDVAIVLGEAATARNYQATVNGARVNGNVSLNAYTGDVVTVALGAGAYACTSVASINRSTAGGYSSTVGTRGILNVGIGTMWPGVVNLGSLGRPC